MDELRNEHFFTLMRSRGGTSEENLRFGSFIRRALQNIVLVDGKVIIRCELQDSLGFDEASCSGN